MNNEETRKPAVQVSALHKSFCNGAQKIEVLRGLNLRVDAGEFVAIMGASGSGKSTLLHLLAGLTAPDSGNIRVGENDLAGMSDGQLARFRRRRIGLVFQAFNLIPSLSAEDNILLPLLMDKVSGGGVLDIEVIEMLGLTARLRHHPDALSGGEQQRVAIARALATRPDIVLADEPTGNLDSITTRSLGRVLSEVNRKRGSAILMVTHDPLVASWASRVLFLRDGSIVEEIQTGDKRDVAHVGSRYLEIMESGREDAA